MLWGHEVGTYCTEGQFPSGISTNHLVLLDLPVYSITRRHPVHIPRPSYRKPAGKPTYTTSRWTTMTNTGSTQPIASRFGITTTVVHTTECFVSGHVEINCWWLVVLILLTASICLVTWYLLLLEKSRMQFRDKEQSLGIWTDVWSWNLSHPFSLHRLWINTNYWFVSPTTQRNFENKILTN